MPDKRVASRTPSTFETPKSPVNQYLPYLNSVLSAVIALNALTVSSKKGVHDGFWLLCLVPACKPRLITTIKVRALTGVLAVVLLVTIYAKRVMLSVDVDELESLKYPYKGA